VFKIELLEVAEIELSDSYDWYEEQQLGLGNRFYKEISYYLNLLESKPYLFPIRYAGDLRTVAINKFPYLIIYWIDEVTNAIYVVSIFHTSRNPRKF